MSKAKTQAKATPDVVAASTNGLQGFDDKTISMLIITAHEEAQKASTHAEAKNKAAKGVCDVADRLRQANKSIDSEAWSSAWRASMRGILPRLHAAKISWVEQTERKMADGSIKVGYKLTSYGQNISSDANQVGQYRIEAAKLDSLQAVRKAIREAKAVEADESMTDQERELSELHDKWTEGCKLVGDLLKEAESVEAYQDALESLAELVEVNTIPDIEVPAEAKAA